MVLPTYTRPAAEANNNAAVFNFVTVRPAQKDTGGAGSRISYQPSYGSAYLNSLSSSATVSSASQAQALAAPDAVVPAGDVADTLQALDGLVQLGRWLQDHRAGLTADAVASVLAQLSPASASPQQLGQVWEALSRITLTGDTHADQEPLQALLRGQHFLDYHAAAGDDPLALRALAVAEVVLPSGVRPPAAPAASAPATPAADVAAAATAAALQAQASQRQQLTDLEQALRELRRLRDVRQETLRNLPSPGQPTNLAAGYNETEATQAAAYGEAQRRADLVDAQAGLTPATQALVAALGPLGSLRLPFLIEQLQGQATALAQQLSQGAVVLQPVFEVGGTLWAENTARATALGTGLATPAALREASAAQADFTAREFSANDFLTDEVVDDPSDAYAGFFSDEVGDYIRPLGIADLNRVEQTLCCYQAGEVAHIENILLGEYKERATRHLLRTELTLDQTTETESTQERDTTTTDRYELTQEATKVLQQDQSLTAGVTAVGQFGPVNVTASSNYAVSTKTEQTDHQTATYAKSVTDRSLQRLVEKVRTQRTSKRTEEFEENNKHGFDNRGGTGHVVGLYRWVDKIYRAQVVNYGKRLMFEFMVPEPGSFHLWARSRTASLVKPNDPRLVALPGTASTEVLSPGALTETNYLAWVGAYGASATPPPAETVRVATALNGSKKGDISDNSMAVLAGTSDDLVAPDGYVATSVYMSADFSQYSGQDEKPGAYINVGDKGNFWATGGTYTQGTFVNKIFDNPIKGKVAVSYGATFTERFTASLVLTCRRTDAAYDAWRLKTYQAILEAYQARQDAYEQAVAAAEAAGQDPAAPSTATPPALTERLIQTELKKGCLNWLSHGKNFSTTAMEPGKPATDTTPAVPPHAKVDAAARADGERAKFLEQCFEWELLSHTLYPYYWADQARWRPLYQLNDADTQLLEFLQAGMARVLVSVRPGYEKAAMYYLASGNVFPLDASGPDSLIFRSVMNELNQDLSKGLRVGEPWEVRVPTTLTVLQQKSGAVEGEGLPCACAPKTSGLGITTADAVLQGKA